MPGGRRCTDAVLVLGGTGKTGQRVVKALLKEGRNVVVASRSKESATELFGMSTPGLYIQVSHRQQHQHQHHQQQQLCRVHRASSYRFAY